MKKLYNIFLLIASFVLLLSACQEKEEYRPGDPDADGCYGVYFPVQNSGTVLDPAAPTISQIKVARVNTSGAITVPYTLNDPAGVLVAGDIVFEDGQSETVMDISFDKAEVGVKYKCSFHISDPQYASKYNSQPNIFDFSILREKWNPLGKCKYTDDIIPSTYNVPIQTWEVEIEESDSKKGLFRLKNVYGPGSPFFEEGVVYEPNYMIVHAEDPAKVYFETYHSDANLGYGNVIMVSIAGMHVQDGKLADAVPYYGRFKKGVITFPTGSLGMAEPEYDGGALYVANAHGAFKIVMPGVVEVDYSIKLEPDLTSQGGQMGIKMNLGRDVAVAKYAAYEGQLNGAQIDKKVADIKDGTEKNTTSITGSSYEVLEFEKTGIYTVVVVTFDKDGKAHEYETTSFGYVAAGDEVPVDCHAGLTSTNKFFPIGQSSDQALEYYLFGNDLKAVKFSLCMTSDLQGPGIFAEVEKLLKRQPVPAEILAKINDKGYVNAFFDLTPGTEYSLLVWAFNGYEENLVMAHSKTTGKLVVELQDMIGSYKGVFDSYFDGQTYMAGFDVAASDNPEKGNLMFKTFMGLECEKPVYMKLDLENNTITIPDGQIFAYHPGLEGNLMFAVASGDNDAITMQVLNKGVFGNPDAMFGISISGGPNDGGWAEVMTSFKATLQQDAQGGLVIPELLPRTLKDNGNMKVKIPFILPDFNALPDLEDTPESVGFTVTSKKINEMPAVIKRLGTPERIIR